MSNVKLLPVDRFLQTLEIVYREGLHLSYSWGRVYSRPIDTSWVKALDTRPEIAEQLEAFVSRFGRMQDTIADKLLPRWLIALAETPGSQIETLNRAEKLGILFGSVGRGQARVHSDLDLAVAADRPLDVSEKVTLIEELEAEIPQAGYLNPVTERE